MVPSSNHDFSQDSWVTVLTGIAKLAVILVTALYLMFLLFMLLLGDMRGAECPENNSIEYEDCILPD